MTKYVVRSIYREFDSRSEAITGLVEAQEEGVDRALSLLEDIDSRVEDPVLYAGIQYLKDCLGHVRKIAETRPDEVKYMIDDYITERTE